MGKTDVEDGFQRLDILTKEENLMTAARTFETTHRVDNKVTVIEEVLQQVDGNIYDIRADVDVIKEGTRSLDDTKTAIDEIQRLLLLDTAIIDHRV